MSNKLHARSWVQTSYTYELGTLVDSDAFWHFNEPDEWQFKSHDATAHYVSVLDTRSKLGELLQVERPGVLRNAGMSAKAPRGKVASDPYDWLLEGRAVKRKQLSVVRGPTSVMLNNTCRSESIQRFHVASTFVDKYVTVELFGLKTGEPKWFFHEYTDRQHVLWNLFNAFPHMFGKLHIPQQEDPASLDQSSFDSYPPSELINICELLRAFRIVQHFTIVKYERTAALSRETVNVRLQIESELCDYRRGRTCYSIPIPGIRKTQSQEPQGDVIDCPLVVIRSRRVAESLELLSTVWQDRFLSTVLITAPPGSGKEQYAASIPVGNGREGASCPYHALALASGDKAILEKQIFGFQRTDGSIAGGLIARSSNGTLFLDEVHQPDDKDGIRASLLRTLENDSYFPVGSSEEFKVRNVLFVLATSRRMTPQGIGSSGKSLSEIPPTDFWTRMAHVLEIPHPLEKLSDPELDASIECFFKHFWWERVSRVFDVTPFVRTSKETTAKTLQCEQAEDLLDESRLERSATIFRKCLRTEFKNGDHKVGTRKASPKDLSIRGIRSMVSNLVSMAAGAVLEGNDWLPATRTRTDFELRANNVIQAVLPVALINSAASPTSGNEPIHMPVKRRIRKKR